MWEWVRRSSAIAAALLVIVGCGGSSSPKRSKPAVFVPPGLSTAPVKPSPPAPSGSPARPGGTTSAGAPSSSSARPASSASASSGHPPASKITFAAPGGESLPAFVSSADAICRSFRARARTIGAGATTLVAQETELQNLVAATQQSLKALTELSPPLDDEPALRRFVTDTTAALVAFAQAQSRTRSTSEAVGSQVEAEDLADSARSSRDTVAATAAAHELGLHVCGSPGAAWL
jgi:hypothetical protein